MLKKTVITIVAIIVVLIVAAVVAPYFVGGAAESNFKARIAWINTQIADRGLSLHVDSYERGFYSSEAEVSLHAVPGSGNEYREKIWMVLMGSPRPVFHFHISHGPIPFSEYWNLAPVLYVAEFEDERLSALSLVGMLKPELYIARDFDGSTYTRLSVPPGRIKVGVFSATWQGGDFAVDLNAARDRAHYSGGLGSIMFQVLNPESGKRYSGKFSGLEFAGSLRAANYGFWVGSQHTAFKGLAVRKNDTRIVEVKAGRVRSQTGMEDGHWLNGRFHLEQKGGSIQGWDWSSLTMDGRISQLDAAVWRRTFDRLRAAMRASKQSGSGELDEQTANAILSDLPKVFASTHARYSLSMAASGGNLDIDARLKLDEPAPSADADADSFSRFVHRIHVKANVGFDREFANAVSVRLSDDPDAPPVDKMLQMLLSKGYLERQDGRYHAVILYRHGRLTVNGKPVDLPEEDEEEQSAPSAASTPAAQSAPVPATAGSL